MTDVKVLVTGANGFIASWMVYFLLEKGYQVRGSVRGANNKKKMAHLLALPGASERLELVDLDMYGSDESFQAAVRGCTYVLHTASPVIIKKVKDESQIIRPAVEGTTKMMRAIAAVNCEKGEDAIKVKRCVYTTSIGAVTAIFDGGRPDREERRKIARGEPILLTENDWVDVSDKKISAYSRSKALAEKAAWDFVKDLTEETGKFELATIAPMMVLGPSISPGFPVTSAFFTQIMTKFVPAVPTFKFWVSDVRDVANAQILAFEKPDAANHRFIIGASPHSMLEMSRWVAKEFKGYGYKIPTRRMPDFLFRIYASIVGGEIKTSAKLLGKEITVDNSPSIDILGLKYHDPKDTVLENAHSVVIHGHVRRTRKYVPADIEIPGKDIASKTSSNGNGKLVASMS